MKSAESNTEIKDRDRIRLIQEHTLFRDLVMKIQSAERERVFCRHTMDHFLDVARLMYIYNMEDRAGMARDVIYAAALLHDIGRYEQITKGIPHDVAGAEIAAEIMQDCGYTGEEIGIVQSAVSAHRDQNSSDSVNRLAAYLYRADKKSRNCSSCPAQAACNWPEEKKNLWMEY